MANTTGFTFTLVAALSTATLALAEDAPPAGEAPSAEPAAAREAAAAHEAEAEEAPPNVREARERVLRGEALFEQGNYGAALVEFQQAYDVIGEHPLRYLVLYNMGQCHERAFRYDQALEAYRRYLAEGGDQTEGGDEVRQTIERLESLLATVRIRLNLDRAVVWVDGHEVGTAPGSIRVPAGQHTIQLHAEGHLDAQEELSLPAGGERELEFTLEPLPEEFEGLHQAWFWTSGALAVSSLVAGIAFGVSAFQAHNDVARRLDDEEAQWSVTDEEIARIGDHALAADLLFGATALFAVGAVVFGVLTNWEGRREGGASRVALRLYGGPHGGGLAGRF